MEPGGNIQINEIRCGMISGEKGRRGSLGRRVFGVQSLGNFHTCEKVLILRKEDSNLSQWPWGTTLQLGPPRHEAIGRNNVEIIISKNIYFISSYSSLVHFTCIVL